MSRLVHLMKGVGSGRRCSHGCAGVALVLIVSVLLADHSQAQTRGQDRRDSRRSGGAEEAPPAEQPPAAPTEVTAASLGLIIYPAGDQSPEQQATDETECIAWAQGEMQEIAAATPEAAAESPEAAASQSKSRAGLKGAARGAAAGAVVDEVREPELGEGNVERGEIRDEVEGADSRDDVRRGVEDAVDDDRSEVAVGATVGAVAGRSRQRKAEAQAAEQQTQAAAQQAQAAEAATVDTLKGAAKTCLEARGYKVD